MARSVDRLISRLEAISDQRTFEEAITVAEQEVNARGMMEQIVEKRFENQSERSYGGSSWAPLAQSTMRSKPGGQILVNTGRLMDSAIRSVAGTYSIRNPVTWSASGITEYSDYVNDGTPSMPARRFMLDPDDDELSDADEVAIDAIAAHLMRSE